MIKIYLAAALAAFFIIFVVMGYCLLIPIMSFAGDSVYNDIHEETDSISLNGPADLNNIDFSTSFPMEDPALWLEGKTAKVNDIFLKRLAALAKKYNRKIYISSGYRTIQEQQEIWDKRKRDHPGEPDSETRRWVGTPGGSRHNYGLAVDCVDWTEGLTNSSLKEFGLIKPLSNEDWHVEPIETRNSGSAVKNGGTKNISAAEVLPQELLWKDFDKEKLRAFLNSRNSILAQDRYLTSIIDICRKKDVNTILMIAITGQEQSYVPKNKPNAEKIANNPFNVYHSWYEYNTDIEDSTSIACNTVINLSKNRPEAIHPIQWINRKYAKDQNWWIGVSNCFDQIKKYVKP